MPSEETEDAECYEDPGDRIERLEKLRRAEDRPPAEEAMRERLLAGQPNADDLKLLDTVDKEDRFLETGKLIPETESESPAAADRRAKKSGQEIADQPEYDHFNSLRGQGKGADSMLLAEPGAGALRKRSDHLAEHGGDTRNPKILAPPAIEPDPEDEKIEPEENLWEGVQISDDMKYLGFGGQKKQGE